LSSSKDFFTNFAYIFLHGSVSIEWMYPCSVQPCTRVPNRSWSFPPIPSDTTSVASLKASNWGGWSGYWASVKLFVAAPPQLTSVSDSFSAAATRCG